jgi:hypothetical protein
MNLDLNVGCVKLIWKAQVATSIVSVVCNRDLIHNSNSDEFPQVIPSLQLITGTYHETRGIYG